MELDPNKRRGMFLSIECINTMNEGLLLQHARHGCPMPKWSKYLSFLKSKTFVERTHPKLLTPRTVQTEVAAEGKEISEPTKKFTLFSTECIPYFDWQAVQDSCTVSTSVASLKISHVFSAVRMKT